MSKKLRTRDVAKMGGVTMSTVTWWANSGKLKGKKVERPVSEGGDQYIFEEKEVILFLQRKYKKYLIDMKKLQNKIDSIEKTLSASSNIYEIVNF